MSMLGDALEAMMASGSDRRTTVHAELVHYIDHAVEAEARHAAAVGRRLPGTVGPAQRRGRMLAAAGMLRVEWPDDDEVTVVRPEAWRRRRGDDVSGSDLAEGGVSHPRPVPVRERVLVQPWLILGGLRMRAVGRTVVAGRVSTRLGGRPRPGTRPCFRDGFTDGADRYDIVIDDATGVVVDLAAFFVGRLVERTTLRRLTLGDVPDLRLFDLDALAPGRPAVPSRRRARPLAELAGEVDFTLLVPGGGSVPGTFAGTPATSFVGRLDATDGSTVVTGRSSRAERGREKITFVQSGGAGMADTTGWETIVLPDGTEALWWAPDGALVEGHLRFERAGTQVWIRGTDRDAMIDLAVGLHPVG
jgi:hypothetical protein